MTYDKELLILTKYLKRTLSPKRYQHSLMVMRKAVEYAQIYGYDVKKARITALAHDIAREMSLEESKEYILKNNLKKSLLDEDNIPLIHGEIGADICKKDYNFTEEMCNAIRCHTTGKENMTTLEKIIYLADKNEDSRVYNNVDSQRKLALESLDEAMIETLKNSIHYTMQKQNKINMKSLDALRFLEKNKK